MSPHAGPRVNHRRAPAGFALAYARQRRCGFDFAGRRAYFSSVTNMSFRTTRPAVSCFPARSFASVKAPALLSGFCLALVLAWASSARAGELFINEILFNPPFTSSDITNEFIELRGTPNLVLPDGTYLVSVEGDTNENPGVIQNRFDLSGRRLGQNGFLVLLQKNHRYRPNILSTVVTNSNSEGGWGSGSSSTVGHRGENGILELENASCTFLLIQTMNTPAIGEDIDIDNDGVPDGSFTNWLVLDSVGVLDGNSEEDRAYGKINFRRTPPSAPGGGTEVIVPFSPNYIGRNGNTTGWADTNWVASDNLLGKPPAFFLGSNSAKTGTNTFPYKLSKAALNHIGGPNFKAPLIPSVIVHESGTNTLVREGGPKDYYLLNLSLKATGVVTVAISAELPAQVSTDGGKTFGAQRTLAFTSTTAKKVYVRALDDGFAGPSQMTVLITHSVLTTLDPRYPTNSLILPVAVTVIDTNLVLLSEVKVNPPGTSDAPFEFVELRGTPGRMLTNLHLVAIQGNSSDNPGRADLVVPLTGRRFGTNGLLIVAAPGNPYIFASGTTVVLAPQLTNAAGALDNGSLSLLLVGSTQPITEGLDLDAGDNGILEGLPERAFIVDAIAWTDSGNNDVIYGGVDLSQRGFTPDAASRLTANNSPRSAAAWFVGDLAGTAGDSLDYDPVNISTNLPPGAVMTPGIVNRKPPRLTPNPLLPMTGVIGDPGNETLTFTLSVLEDDDDNFKPDDDADDYIPARFLTVTATSTNQLVVPDSNLTLANFAPGQWRLVIVPVGIGYSDIVIRATDGTYTRLGYLHYAASAPGRSNTMWHPGVSDASTAIPIDASWMFIGDDENQTLRIYSRTRSGGPVVSKDFSQALQLLDYYDSGPLAGEPREVDIEGSTRVGNRIYWMGSHSHAFNATERTNRGRIFATDVSGTGTNTQLKLLAHYDFLKLDLMNWDANNVHGKGANYYGLVQSGAEGTNPKAPDGSGFNLEGLCMAPGPGNTTNCYIAFRAPLVPPTNRVNALIIPVRNYGRITTKASGPGSALFGAPIELNLGGRAIRSIEGFGGTNYLLIAGPPGSPDTNGVIPPPGNFRLFTWTGQPTNQPAERAADLTGLNAEGIVEVFPGAWTATNLFQIISDNGTNIFYGDGIQAKHLQIEGLPREFKKFRVDTVALGDIVAPAPLIRSASNADGVITVNWFSVSGNTYRLQMKPALVAEWSDVPGDVIAGGSTAGKSIQSAPDAQCFFRVIAVR